MFDSLFGDLVSVAILLGLGFWLLQNRHVILKLVGAIFALLALAQALSSPALLTLVGILALLYVGFVAVKMAMKRRKQARKCRDCEHEAHGGGRCRNRYCRCDE